MIYHLSPLKILTNNGPGKFCAIIILNRSTYCLTGGFTASELESFKYLQMSVRIHETSHDCNCGITDGICLNGTSGKIPFFDNKVNNLKLLNIIIKLCLIYTNKINLLLSVDNIFLASSC